MSAFSTVKRFGLLRVCAIAIVSAAFTAPAAAQRSAEREETDQNDAEASPSDDERALLKAIEEQREIAEQQRAEATEQYRRAISELERVRRRGSSEAQAELAQMKAALEAAHAQLAELQARRKQELQAQAEPLPENSVLRVYHLQHVKPQNLAEILGPIFRNNAPRMSVDERSNTLLVAGNEKQLSIVEDLAQTLDRPTPQTEPRNTSETLQVRIVWLLDIADGMEPTDKLMSPQVVEALSELGFERPKVICQQVATLTLGDNRGGQFQFQVPVLIKSQQWQFEGKGFVGRMTDERFHVEFNLSFQQVTPNGQAFGQVSRLGGSIHTPLAHYTVMGTTSFVVDRDQSGSEEQQPQQDQHLSAFVVYLDRAKEFPASGARAENQSERQR
jgi:hypothetical protein